jgi:DNA helicase-2/ATP-dependent DNA helicase PcrA
MRLLTGTAINLGAADLAALGAWAAELVRRSGVRSTRAAVPADRLETDPVDGRSIVDALDALPDPDWEAPGGERFSPTGRRRLNRLAATLRGLRAHLAVPLPDLVQEVERALLLDIEVAAPPGVDPGWARPTWTPSATWSPPSPRLANTPPWGRCWGGWPRPRPGNAGWNPCHDHPGGRRSPADGARGQRPGVGCGGRGGAGEGTFPAAARLGGPG